MDLSTLTDDELLRAEKQAKSEIAALTNKQMAMKILNKLGH